MIQFVDRREWQDRATEALALAGGLDRQRAELLVEIGRLYSALASIERYDRADNQSCSRSSASGNSCTTVPLSSSRLAPTPT